MTVKAEKTIHDVNVMTTPRPDKSAHGRRRRRQSQILRAVSLNPGLAWEDDFDNF